MEPLRDKGLLFFRGMLPRIKRVMSGKGIVARGGIFLFLICLAGGCASDPGVMTVPAQRTLAPVSPVSPISPQIYSSPQTVTHVVGPLETLSRISKSYSVDMQTIMNANGIRDPNQLKIGQKLIIPNTLGPRSVIPLYPSNKWEYIVVHHTATDIGNALTIHELHHKRGFWHGLGYHFLIDNGSVGKVDGFIEIGPRWIKQMDGAHAKDSGMNAKAIGIGIVGNYSEQPISRETFNSLVYLVRLLQRQYGIPSHKVIGHRDVPGAKTECPGKLFPWAEFKRQIA